MLVSFYRFMKDILRSYSQWQCSRIDHFNSVRMDINKNISSYRIRAMHQRIAGQFSDYRFIIRRNLLAEQSVADFIAFPPNRHIFPYRLNDFLRIFGKVINQVFPYLIPILVKLDTLHHRRIHQSASLRLGSDKKHSQVSHFVRLFHSQEIIIQKFLILFLLYEFRYTV